MTKKNHQPPIAQVRQGRIKAAIWERNGQNGPFYTVSISRTYSDVDGNFQDSGSFGRNDLLLLSKVADLAHTQIEQMIVANAEVASEASAAE